MPQANPFFETESRTIDNIEYEVTQFMGRKALKIKMKLIRILAPIVSSLVSAISGTGKSITEADIDFAKVGDALSSLFETMDEDQLIDFIIDLLSMTKKAGLMIDAKNFEHAFVGNFVSMYKVLFFVIQVNYPDFFQMGASIGNLKDRFQEQVSKTT